MDSTKQMLFNSILFLNAMGIYFDEICLFMFNSS